MKKELEWNILLFLSPAYEVRGKVMFSLCPSTGLAGGYPGQDQGVLPAPPLWPGPGQGTNRPAEPARTRTGYLLPHPTQDQDRIHPGPTPPPNQDQDRVPQPHPTPSQDQDRVPPVPPPLGRKCYGQDTAWVVRWGIKSLCRYTWKFFETYETFICSKVHFCRTFKAHGLRIFELNDFVESCINIIQCKQVEIFCVVPWLNQRIR